MITLYTTNCPRCRILETKLQQKSINYTRCGDVQSLIDMGYETAPVLKVNNEYMTFGDAIKWVNKQ